MYSHAARFVDDDYVAVLVEDVEGNILRKCLSAYRRRDFQPYLLAAVQSVVGFLHCSVHRQPAFIKKLLNPCPGNILKFLRHKSIQSGALFLGSNGQCIYFIFHIFR